MLAFAVLVLALSRPMTSIGGPEPWSPTNLLGPLLGPGGCAFLATWLADGSAGVRELFGRALRWRAPVRWYLRVGVYAVIAIALIAVTRGRLGSDLHHIDGRRSGDSVDTVPPHGAR